MNTNTKYEWLGQQFLYEFHFKKIFEIHDGLSQLKIIEPVH
jgi:hypothetical protein